VVAASGQPENALMSMGPWSPLGTAGPLGAYGPQGELGPVGSGAWNPSTYISGGHWEGTSDALAAAGGPRGPAGVLSERSMVGVNWFDGGVVDPLKPGGSAAILGPSGPAGPLGLTGPLGPVGVHGHRRDEQGHFRDASGQIVRTMDAAYDERTLRTWDLYELYTESAAQQMRDNDTSFAVDGTLTGGQEADSYSFNVDHPQFVAINVVPRDAGTNFDLVVHDAAGKELFATRSGSEVSWVQIMCAPGTYRVQVKLNDLGRRRRQAAARYRLEVTGTQRMKF
jgi:hypothetical protein